MLKKWWFHLALLIFFGAAIILLMFLDYFNLEKIAFFNDTGFLFDYTWKGRLFLLFFVWLFVLESFLSIDALKEAKLKNEHRNRLKTIVILAFAAIPLIYIVAVNFMGLDQAVIQAGDWLRGDYWRANWHYWENSLHGDWPLSLEYVVFTLSFSATVLLAYGKKGLKLFALSAGIIAGISIFYMIDTLFPATGFAPLQALALPTAACAAVVLQAIGIPFHLNYIPGYGSAPIISVTMPGGISIPTSVAWPCAGVHSLFLYTVIVLLLFKKSGISGFRQSIYFMIGAVGTYFVNVLRIVNYFVILLNQGQEAALIFHNVYGELYFFAWILGFILLVVGIQKYKLVERTKALIFKNRHSSVLQEPT